MEQSYFPHCQEPAICLFPELDQFSPCPIQLSEDPFQYYPPICAGMFQVVSVPHVSQLKPRTHHSSPHTCYVPSPIISI